MHSMRNSHQKRSLTQSHSIFFLSIVFIVILVIVTTLSASAQASKRVTRQAGASFKFTAAGDYGQTNYTTANLTYIAHSGVSFHLALGDFSYDPSVNAATWSAYVKSLLPANFPFEILEGGHDGSQIKTYAADLPNHMANMTGTYAHQYSFDYPANAPLARFIMITPGGNNSFAYSRGTPGYTWVSNAIDGARAAKIHWVIVAMHQYCFVIGSTYCNGQDLLDLLLTKHVDLILQAQKHDYQASKQLALNTTTCTSLPVTNYNSHCVVNSSASMTKGVGSVIVVTGTGGTTPELAINTKDPKIGYFRSWMGANVNQSWGVSQFTVSSTQLSMQFVSVTGSFTDSFSING